MKLRDDNRSTTSELFRYFLFNSGDVMVEDFCANRIFFLLIYFKHVA